VAVPRNSQGDEKKKGVGIEHLIKRSKKGGEQQAATSVEADRDQQAWMRINNQLLQKKKQEQN